jgi:hypothetical protein
MAFQAGDSEPSVEPPVEVVDAEGNFLGVVETRIAGRPERLRRTGTAVRKKLRIAFYRIAGYCDTDAAPADVDALAAADCPKRLVLIMERNIPDWVLKKSFEDAFAANDPEGRFADKFAQLLNHMTARPLVKGDCVTLTHLPQIGLECRIGDAAPITVADPAFAHVVWNVYMGPRGVCPTLRAGLGTELAAE